MAHKGQEQPHSEGDALALGQWSSVSHKDAGCWGEGGERDKPIPPGGSSPINFLLSNDILEPFKQCPRGKLKSR